MRLAGPVSSYGPRKALQDIDVAVPAWWAFPGRKYQASHLHESHVAGHYHMICWTRDWAQRQSRHNPMTILAGHPVIIGLGASTSGVADGLSCESLGRGSFELDMLDLGLRSGADAGVGSGAGAGKLRTHYPEGSGSLAVATGGHEQQSRGCRPSHRQQELQRLSSRRVLGPARGHSD